MSQKHSLSKVTVTNKIESPLEIGQLWFSEQTITCASAE